MGNAHRGICRVHRLPTRPRRAECINAEVFRFNLYVHILCLGQNRNGDCGGVNTTLLLSRRHTLHSVHSALIFHARKHPLTFNQSNDFLQSASRRFGSRQNLHLPALGLGVSGVHAKQFRRKQSSLVATSSCPDFQNHILLIIGILGQKQNLEFFFDPADARLQFVQLLLSIGAHIRILLVASTARLSAMPRFKSLYSRYRSTMRLISLCALAVFWYFAESLIISGEASACVRSS